MRKLLLATALATGLLTSACSITVEHVVTVADAVKEITNATAKGCGIIPVAADLYVYFKKQPGKVQDWAALAFQICNSVFNNKVAARRAGGAVVINGVVIRYNKGR